MIKSSTISSVLTIAVLTTPTVQASSVNKHLHDVKPHHIHHTTKKSNKTKRVGLDKYVHALCKASCVNTKDLLVAVKTSSRKHHLNKNLVMAVIKTESDFNSKASSKGNKGLLQVNYTVHSEKFSGRSVYNVRANVDVGTKVLRDCSNDNKSIDEILTCYKGSYSSNYIAEVKQAMVKLAKL
jgi:hypothetical protein